MKVLLLTILLASGISLSAQEKKTEGIKPALLVIDIQNQYLPLMDQREKDFALYAINAYIEGFRQGGFPIIRIHHSDPQQGPFPGTVEFDFPADIKVLPEDPQIIKTYGDAFNKTDLAKLLQDKGVNTLFLCGLSSVGCVLATYIGAHNHDFKAFLLKDAIMSHDKDYTDQIEVIFSALGYEAVEVMLENAVK